MNNVELLAFSILRIAVLVHMPLVNITIGTGWISAMARFLGWRRGDADLELMSRRVFKILIIHELFSGVWGTIITIILAGFFPALMAIATDVLFYPILIALASIFIRIPTIALFWYTWGKIRPAIHSALGFVMALSGFGVPFGFRYIFAETSFPHAIGLALEGLSEQARTAVFLNPVYFPLVIHTWMIAMSVGGFIVASFFAIKKNVNSKFAWIGLWHGLLFLAAQAVTGPWYMSILADKAPLIYNNMLGLGGATFNVLPLMAAVVAILVFLAGLSAPVWSRLKKGMGDVPRYTLALGPLAVATVIIWEFLNDAGKYPYMVLMGGDGLGPAAFMNVYLDIPITIVYAILGSLILFIGLFMTAAYYGLNKRFLKDMPEV
jgi:cytochrome d ubiquinol oxidase subunit I